MIFSLWLFPLNGRDTKSLSINLGLLRRTAYVMNLYSVMLFTFVYGFEEGISKRGIIERGFEVKFTGFERLAWMTNSAGFPFLISAPTHSSVTSHIKTKKNQSPHNLLVFIFFLRRHSGLSQKREKSHNEYEHPPVLKTLYWACHTSQNKPG